MTRKTVEYECQLIKVNKDRMKAIRMRKRMHCKRKTLKDLEEEEEENEELFE